jgi:hypothetical protein
MKDVDHALDANRIDRAVDVAVEALDERRRRQREMSEQMSIGHFRRRLSPSVVAIHEQKRWRSGLLWHAIRHYEIYSDNALRLAR